MRSLVIVSVILGLCGAAHADWFYTWSCAGTCAPTNTLGIKGVEGPYGSYDTCERIRQSDSRNQTFLAPGSLGGTFTCSESSTAPSATSGAPLGPAVGQRVSVTAFAGSGWKVRDLAGATAVGDRTIGGEVAAVLGGRPSFGLQVSVGVQSSTLTMPGATAETRLTYVPLMFGMNIGPSLGHYGRFHPRLDLGADGGFTFRIGCTDCDAMNVSASGLLYAFRAGLVVYVGPTLGIAVGTVFTFGKHGDVSDEFSPSAYETTPPWLMFRVALVFRNSELDW